MRRRSLVLAVPLLALAGCGGGGAKTSAVPPHPKTCVPGSFRAYGSYRLAYAAIVRSHAAAARRPGGASFARFGRLNVNHVPMIFSILGARVDRGCSATWFRVELPMRPNGIAGWVRASDVIVASVDTRIEVDLSTRRLTLFRAGRPLLTSRVAIGSAATPTPTGRFYVNQRLIPTDSTGPFGPGAVGISAFSNVLTGWTQGGPIAIHGTNEPWSIGRAVSNGCIRLPNPVLRRVFRQALSGTPVVIHA